MKLKHHSALMIQIIMAIAAAGLPEKEILGPLCAKKDLQHCACWIDLQDENTILILLLLQLSPTLSSIVKYPTPHRQYNIRSFSHTLHSQKTYF